jgi:hypothetical protein
MLLRGSPLLLARYIAALADFLLTYFLGSNLLIVAHVIFVIAHVHRSRLQHTRYYDHYIA